jgi:hypothetical protein
MDRGLIRLKHDLQKVPRPPQRSGVVAPSPHLATPDFPLYLHLEDCHQTQALRWDCLTDAENFPFW